MHDDDPLDDTGEVLEAGGDDRRRPARTAFLALAALGAAAVWWFGGPDGSDDDAPSATPAAAGTQPGDAGDSPEVPLGDEDGNDGLAEAFHLFAETGDASEVTEWWADFVTVSARGATWTMSRREADRRDAWRLPADSERASRDALDPLTTSDGAFTVYHEDMECGCHGNPRPAESNGRVSSRVLVAVRPPAGTACESWWAIDLVLTPEDKVSQVLVRRAAGSEGSAAPSGQ